MIVAIAEGVKGLLRRRRESFVVWARREEASWRRERAFGGLGMGFWWEGVERMVWKVWRRVVSVVSGAERRAGDEGGGGMLRGDMFRRTALDFRYL